VSEGDETARFAEQKAREQSEADLVYNRIRELRLDPIKGGSTPII
jgi:hypothetical protein